MAHFLGRVEGTRGPAQRLGGPGSGINTSANGWSSGVDVLGSVDEATGRDVFRITATGGSGRGGSKHIGFVTTNKKGEPIFKKSLQGRAQVIG